MSNKYPIVEIFYEMNGKYLTCGPFEEYSPEFVEAENTIFDRGGRVLAIEELDNQVKVRQAMEVMA